MNERDLKDYDLNDPEDLRALCQELDDLGQGLRAFYKIFPAGLTEGERRTHASRIFAAAPALVRRTAGALAEHRDLFADVPVRPEVLQARQDLADRLDRLRRHFIALLRLCGDFFLSMQDEAAQQALDVLRDVRLQGERPFGRPPRQEERELALRLAQDVAPCRGRAAALKKSGKGRR